MRGGGSRRRLRRLIVRCCDGGGGGGRDHGAGGGSTSGGRGQRTELQRGVLRPGHKHLKLVQLGGVLHIVLPRCGLCRYRASGHAGHARVLQISLLRCSLGAHGALRQSRHVGTDSTRTAALLIHAVVRTRTSLCYNVLQQCTAAGTTTAAVFIAHQYITHVWGGGGGEGRRKEGSPHPLPPPPSLPP